MSDQTIGILHPGAMGVTVASAARAAGHEVLWASDGRSSATQSRAKEAGLRDVGNLEQLVRESDVILSVCPPASAVTVANEVLRCGFRGTFVDANAVAPETARSIDRTLEGAGVRFVDGGIVGPPAHRQGTTRLYLSGERAAQVGSLFEGSVLGTVVVNAVPGSASALKMCYAAYTKGTAALLIAIRGLAAAEGVESALLGEWALSQPDLKKRSEVTARATAPRAWRFVGEMQEIASTFEARGLPGDFHAGAAKIYGALSRFKDCEEPPSLASVLRALAGDGAS